MAVGHAELPLGGRVLFEVLHHVGQAGGAGLQRTGFGLLLELLSKLESKIRQIIPNEGIDVSSIHY